MTSSTRHTFAIVSPPNPNGDLHAGHLAGPYLAADIYARHRRMLGERAFFGLSTDDNQIWTEVKAKQLGQDPQATADHYAGIIAETLSRADARPSALMRPNASRHHRRIVEETVLEMHRRGLLVEKEKDALFCPDTGRCLFEWYVDGGCPHCGEPTYGNGCEACGRPNQVTDLIDPRVKETGKTPERRPLRRLFFPLEPHREFLERYVEETAMSTQHRALLRTLFDSELPEVTVSQPVDWGIPLPIEGFPGHRIFAWLEMAPGYLATAQEVTDAQGVEGGWERFYRTEEGRVVMFFGFDNCWYHGLIYPALYHALDIRPPVAFVSNELYLLDHQKFSTSRGHAVWARELVEAHHPDVVRAFLSYTRPEARQTNFSHGELQAYLRDELAGRWQGWLGELGERVASGSGAAVPEAAEPTPNQEFFARRIERLLAEGEEAYHHASFSTQKVHVAASELIRLAGDFGAAEAAWAPLASARAEHRTALALELAAAGALAQLAAPILPTFADRLWQALGYPGQATESRWPVSLDPPPAGRPVGDLAASLRFEPETPTSDPQR